MRFNSLFIGMSLLVLGCAVMPIDLCAHADARQAPGQRIVTNRHPNQPRQQLPKPRKSSSKFNVDFGFFFNRPVYCPPPPRPVYVYQRPIVCHQTVVEHVVSNKIVDRRGIADETARILKLVCKDRDGDRVSLDGRYSNLESVDVVVEGPSARLNMDGEYPKLTDINVDSYSGEIRGRFRGHFPELSDVSCRSRSGDIDLDLTGRWTRDCTVDVNSGSGDIRLRLPTDIDVVVKSDASHSIQAHDFNSRETLDGKIIYSRSGQAGVTLTIHVRGQGKIVIH